MKNNKKSIKEYIAAFSAEYDGATKSVLEMGRIYAAALKEYPGAGAAFAERWPLVSENRWQRLRLIGNGDVDPAIWHASDKAAMEILRLCEADRKKVLAAHSVGVDVVDAKGNVRKVRLENLTERDLQVLRNGQKIRTVEEQRRFLEERARRRKAERPWMVNGGCVEFARKCTVGKSELKDMFVEVCGGTLAAAQYILGAAQKAG